MSPLAQQWMKYLPTPTSSGAFNNYLGVPVSDGILSNVNHFLYKIFFFFFLVAVATTSGTRTTISCATIWRQKTQPNEQCALPVELCTSSPANPEDAWVSRFNYDHIFTPTLLSHFAYGYVNRNEGYGSVTGQDPTVLPQIPNAVAYNASPAANFSGNGITNFASWGNTQGPGYLNKSTRPTHIANELITWVHGSHTIKFGGEYRHLQEVFRNNNNQSGTVGFSALSTALPGVDSGDPFAEFIYRHAVDNGNLNAYNVAKYGPIQRAYSLHVGDTWKVSPKFTINYGLRWDRFSPTWETGDLSSFFSFTPNPGAGNRPGSLVFAGNKYGAASAGERYPEKAFNGAFAPRIVMAYQLVNKMVARAGYGVFYTQAFYPGWGCGISLDGFNPQRELQRLPRRLLNLRSIWIEDFRRIAFLLRILAGQPSNGSSGPKYRPTDANHLSYTQQWNISVERKIGNSAIASVAYVASKGTHLPSQLKPLNVLNPSLLTSMGSTELNTVFQPGQTSLFQELRRRMRTGSAT